MLGRLAAGPDPGDEAAVLLHVVGGVDRVEGDRVVEVGEPDDQQEVGDDVERVAAGAGEPLHEVGQPVPVHDRGQQHRDVEQAGGEDDRDDAGLVDLEGDVGRLAAVHPPPHHPLGVLHRDPALGLLDEDHGHDDQQAEEADQPEDEALVDPQDVGALAGQGGHDRREDDDRHAVADPAGGDQLAQPHDQRRPRGQGEHGQGEPARGQPGEDVQGQDPLVVGQLHDAGRLEQGQEHRHVAGVLLDLLAPALALLLELLQPGDDHPEELHDDRGGDVGHDPQGEDGELGQRPAREQVDQRERAAGVLGRVLQVVLDGVEVDPGHRQVGPEPVDGDDGHGEEDLAPQLGDLEGVAKGRQHPRVSSPLRPRRPLPYRLRR